MNRGRLILQVLLVTIVLAMWAFVGIGYTSAAEWHVYPGQSIQTAINNAGVDDTIFVHAGTYSENVNLNKRLTLIGVGTPVITTVSTDETITLSADGITFEGFTAISSNSSAIKVISSHNILAGNTVYQNLVGETIYWGIHFDNSNSNTITDNTFYNNEGIALFSSGSNILAGNIVSNNRFGFYLDQSSGNTITNNTISNNSLGIFIQQSGNNTLLGNSDSNNSEYGIRLYVCSGDSIITGNTISNNGMGGISLVYSSDNIITDNTVSNNGEYGLMLDSSGNNTIAGNLVFNNTNAGIMLDYFTDNKIYLNNFMNNAVNVFSLSSSNIWNSTVPVTYAYAGAIFTNYLGNYWDDYTGSDADCDGIGDTSYVIPYDNNDNYPLMKPWENYFVETKNIKIVSFDTDKEVYNAKEEINFFLSIYAPKNISDALIEVKGVKSTKGVYFVYYSNLTDLVIGLNNISFIKKLPSCIKCAGLSAGTYFITASVTYDAEVVTATHSIVLIKHIFDTGSAATPYPSIAGTHNGTIIPSGNLTVLTLYTYPCAGTGGHTEYVTFYNATTGKEIANGTWKGYQGLGDFHYLEFESLFVLRKNETYNYTICTGSYPQIIHQHEYNAIGGVITCTEFVDINGQRHEGGIPAIRLE